MPSVTLQVGGVLFLVDPVFIGGIKVSCFEEFENQMTKGSFSSGDGDGRMSIAEIL